MSLSIPLYSPLAAEPYRISESMEFLSSDRTLSLRAAMVLWWEGVVFNAAIRSYFFFGVINRCEVVFISGCC